MENIGSSWMDGWTSIQKKNLKKKPEQCSSKHHYYQDIYEECRKK